MLGKLGVFVKKKKKLTQEDIFFIYICCIHAISVHPMFIIGLEEYL